MTACPISNCTVYRHIHACMSSRDFRIVKCRLARVCQLLLRGCTTASNDWRKYRLRQTTASFIHVTMLHLLYICIHYNFFYYSISALFKWICFLRACWACISSVIEWEVCVACLPMLKRATVHVTFQTEPCILQSSAIYNQAVCQWNGDDNSAMKTFITSRP